MRFDMKDSGPKLKLGNCFQYMLSANITNSKF